MQVAVNGIISGVTIAVFALAFSITYLPTRVFHVALGGVFTSVLFITWMCLTSGWPWYFAALTGVIVGVGLSIACELVNHRRLEKKGASSGAHLVSSLGVYILIVQAIVVTWGTEPKVLRVGLDSIVSIFGLVLTRAQLIAGGLSIASLLAFYFWLRLSNLGLQFRALADNPGEMIVRGYNVQRLRLVCFGLSGLLAGVSALAFATDIGFDPYGGLNTLILAVVAMIIGGRNSIIGPVVGGLVLGIMRSEVLWFLSASWQEAMTFLLLAAFLLLRPSGLIGERQRLEANT